MDWLVGLTLGILLFFILGWVTGSEEWGYKTNDDERKKYIKQKSIVNSWVILLTLLLINFIFDVFNLRDERLDNVPFVYPELLYLIIAVISYFVFYVIHSRRSL